MCAQTCAFGHTNTLVCAKTRAFEHTNTHTGARAHMTQTHNLTRKGKAGYSVSGEGVTKLAASGPFNTFCHHVGDKTCQSEKTSRLCIKFDTFCHRATGSSSLLKAIQNFNLGLIEAGIINTIHNNSQNTP